MLATSVEEHPNLCRGTMTSGNNRNYRQIKEQSPEPAYSSYQSSRVCNLPAVSVHHNISLLLLRLLLLLLLLRRLGLGALLGATVGVILAIVHLDVFALALLLALTLLVFKVLFLVILALGLEVLGSGVALLVIVLTVGLDALHIMVLALGLGCDGGGAQSSRLAAFGETFLLFLLLVCAVSRTVVLGGVHVRLLRREFSGRALVAVPFDSEAGDSGLLGEDVAADLLDDGLGGRLVDQLLVGVLVADVVADADELPAVVGASEQDDGDAKDLGCGDVGGVGRVGLEDELVDADGDGTDEEGVEFLIVLRAGKSVSGLLDV